MLCGHGPAPSLYIGNGLEPNEWFRDFSRSEPNPEVSDPEHDEIRHIARGLRQIQEERYQGCPARGYKRRMKYKDQGIKTRDGLE